MTAFLEEADRLLNLAKRDQAAFVALLGVEAAGVSLVFMHNKPQKKVLKPSWFCMV